MIGDYCLTFIFVLVTATELGYARDVQVSTLDCFQTRTPSCVRITDALKQLSSNTTLHLLPGEHRLEEFALVQRLSNIALIGGTHKSNISITCNKGVGLAFVSVRNLTIQHITVHQCGLSGENLENVMLAVKKKIAAFFEVPLSLDIALLLADITDACIKHIAVQNTTGIGLLGINLVGSSSLINSTFLHNVNEECSIPRLLYELLNVDNARQIGGGAFLVYYDYNNTFNMEDNHIELTIQDSTFLENSDCSVSGSIAQRMQFSAALRRRGYTVGGGGGLSIVLSQKSYFTSISVMSCSFVRNLGQFGGGLYLAFFSSLGASSVVLSDCHFIENGGVDLTDGGGMAILGDLVRPFGYNNTEATLSSFSLEIVDSLFVKNAAFLGGGTYIRLVSGSLDKFSSGHNATTLTFCDCTFQSNIAKFGAALYIHEYNVITAEVYDKPLGSLVELSNFRAENNTLLNPIRKSANHSGIIDLRYIYFTLRGECTFGHNSGTAIRARRSPIHIHNHAVFHGNLGTFGGAMALVAYSYLIIHANTSVEFTNNRATVNGGVFHVNVPDQPEYALFDCFLYLNSSDAFYCYDSTTCSTKSIYQLGISVTFVNNSAPLGSLVYGSALQSCPWGNVLRTGDSNNTLNFWLYLAQNEQTNNIFDFGRQPDGIDQVTTPSYKLKNRETGLSRSVMPGQKFEIKMRAADRLEQQIPIAVTSTVVSNTQPEDHDNQDMVPISILGYSNYWGLAKQDDTSVQMRVLGRRGDNVNVSIFTTDSAEETKIQVHLLDCYPGFTLNVPENTSCVCIPELHNEGIRCSNDTHELMIPHSVWLGPLSKTNNQSLVVARCVLDYCQPGVKVIQVQSEKSFDEQCADGYNRTGLLCGLCRDGNSVVLGTRRCKVCSNNAFLALILVFAAAGILLIALVAFLKVSVGEGYINGLLFYSHIVSPYIFDLAPMAPAIFLPVSFLSLALGIETCFYNGMTSLQYTGLQFVFPFYLYFLMAAIVVSARFIKWPHNIGFSAGKTFATLLTVSYASILRTCTVILGNITVRSITRPEESSSAHWYVDPSVRYFSGLHAVLVCISLLLLVLYVIPLPIVLLFPSKAYQFKYTRKMKPILDAFFSPYKPKFRCWIGVRFLFSVCILAVGLFLQYSQTALMLIVTTLVIFVYIQLLIMPYNGLCRNASDSFLLVNIIILLLGTVFNERYSLYENTNKVQQVKTIYSAVVVALAYVVFIAVLLYHTYLRLSHSKQMKIMESFKCIKKALESCTEGESGRASSCKEVDVTCGYYRFEEESIERHDIASSVVDGPGSIEGHATTSSIVEVPCGTDPSGENESATSNFANIHNSTGTEML